MTTSTNELERELRAASARFHELVARLEPGQFDQPTYAGWTPKEMLGHMGFWTEAIEAVIQTMLRDGSLPDDWAFGSGYVPSQDAEWPRASVHNAREAGWARGQSLDEVLSRLARAEERAFEIVEGLSAAEVADDKFRSYVAEKVRHYGEHGAELYHLLDGAPANSVVRSLLSQVTWWWDSIFRRRLVGLTDDEYFWEPADGCWTIHPAGEGLVTYDHAWPPPDPAPLTTIAWRLCHIGFGCLAGRASRFYPDEVDEPVLQRLWEGPLSFPASAQAAVAYLDHWWEIWLRGIRSAGEADLWQPIGDRDMAAPEMQLGAEDPRINYIFHIHRELMHHGAEVNLLRDLYARFPLK